MSATVRERLETDATYAVYLDRQQADIAAFRRDEGVVLPTEHRLPRHCRACRTRSRPSSTACGPKTLGQAARIEGITPAALTLLAAHARKAHRSARRIAEPLS